ncbi:MAG: sigma 54-interacting transcriptional regulator [Nitrospira sp.]|nr:sigma 54-interacting transcriptional regulator [Nitrospira sp.]
MKSNPLMELSRHRLQQQWIPAGLIGLAVTLLIGILWISAPAVLETWEWRTYDLRMQWRGARPTTNQLMLISRDEKSDARFGVGIWDRAVFAKMITALHRAGASVIALDFYFGEASPQERGGKLSDQALVDAAATAGTVLFPLRVSFDHDVEDMPVLPPRLKQRLLDGGSPIDPVFLQRLPQAGSISTLMPGLINMAQGFGHIGASSDPDGVYRRVPIFVNGGGTTIPAMGVALAAAYLKVKPNAMRLIPGETLELKGAIFPDGTRRDLSMPVDMRGNILIDYVGRWVDDPFPNQHFSFVDVWDSIEGKGAEEELRKYVAGKAVLILHAALESDKRRTPLELTAPGGFILANTFSTVVAGRGLRLLPNWMQWGTIMAFTTAVAWMVLAFPIWRGLMAAGGLGGGYLFATYVWFVSFNVVGPMVGPMVGLVLATGSALAWTSRLSFGQIQESESKRLVLQQEVMGLQELLGEQEAHVKRSESEFVNAQSTSVVLQQELKDLQKLLSEQEIHIKLVESDLAATQAAANTGQIRSALVRESLEAELRRVKEEKTRTEQSAMQLRGRFDHEMQVRDSREAELHQVKEDLEKTKQALMERTNKPTDLWVVEIKSSVFSSAEAQELRKQCEDNKIITNDPGVLNIWKLLRKAAPFNKIILILGESGTGKERFAKAAHDLSGRRGRFIPVNMATIEQEHAESRLFGHVKGAFTDAVRDHDGHFLQANNGTLFLDEIGELQLNLQAKLLRVLEDKAIWSMGAKESKPVDVRVVCATNRDLEQEVKEGRFREDLYHRLNVITLRLPPLRERPDDIPLLAKYFVDQMVQDEHLPKIELSQGAVDRLKVWPWRGNIRELRNVLEKAIVFADGSVITEHNLGLGKESEESVEMPIGGTESPMTLNTTGSDLDPDELRLLTALRRHSFAIGSAAEELDWSRDTVTEWWKGLCFKTLVKHEFDLDKAAASLAKESGLAKLVLKKLNEYVKGLDKVVTAEPPSIDFHAWCKKHFRNLPARYYPSVETLIRSRVV